MFDLFKVLNINVVTTVVYTQAYNTMFYYTKRLGLMLPFSPIKKITYEGNVYI